MEPPFNPYPFLNWESSIFTFQPELIEIKPPERDVEYAAVLASIEDRGKTILLKLEKEMDTSEKSINIPALWAKAILLSNIELDISVGAKSKEIVFPSFAVLFLW